LKNYLELLLLYESSLAGSGVTAGVRGHEGFQYVASERNINSHVLKDIYCNLYIYF